MEAPEVFGLVNEFLKISSDAVTGHGGTISKYIGDCILAAFPIHRIDEAIEAAQEINRMLTLTRKSARPEDPLSVLVCFLWK